MSSRRVSRKAGAVALLLTAIVVAAVSCSRPPGKELQPGSYRAVVDVGVAREVPFGLDIAREEHGFVLHVLNGDERIRVTEVQVQAGRVTARLPGYETILDAEIVGDELRGTVTLSYASERRREWPFRARLGETWRFFPDSRNDNADMSGRWAVTFEDPAGRSSQAIAELRQRFDQVDGTVIGPANDERFLAGEVHDEELRLSRFDGGALVVYRGKLDAQGRWVGEAWSDRGDARRFVATRDPDASVDTGTFATGGAKPFAEPLRFEFPDLDGRPVASTDALQGGKATLVALLGSWSPSSHDAATLLGQLEREYGDRGLAVVGLMFEQHAEFERAVAAIGRFREACDVRFPTLVAATADLTAAGKALPQLGGVRAYPTLLFLDRSGRVRNVHTGWHGPAAGALHEQMVREFEQAIEGLLADQAAGSANPAADAGGAAP